MAILFRMLLNTLECHERADHETALSQMKEVGIPEEDERIIRKCYQVFLMHMKQRFFGTIVR